MKNLKIKGVSFSDVVIDDPKLKTWSNLPQIAGLAGGHIDLKIFPEVLSAEKLITNDVLKKKKVELSVEGIDITADFVNIWVGEELLLGTMVDEKASLITGYISDLAPTTASVTVEYPDGRRVPFNAPVIV